MSFSPARNLSSLFSPEKYASLETTAKCALWRLNLAAEARARGLSIEVYVQEILARQTIEATGEGRLQSVRAAIDRILDLRKGNVLAGLRTKDLIHADHKY